MIRKYGRYTLALFLLFYVHAVYCQAKDWDTSFRPEIYPLLNDLYQAEPTDTSDIVFLGNSITFWGLFNQSLGLPGIKNRGIPGDITNGVLERLDAIVKGRPAKIFILIGINDIARGIPDSIVIHNQRRMVDAIRKGSPHTRIYLQTILPTNRSFGKLPNHYGKEQHILTVNNGLRQIASETGAILIDLHALFDDGSNQLIQELSFDGVHLNKKGYDRWVALLKELHCLDNL